MYIRLSYDPSRPTIVERTQHHISGWAYWSTDPDLAKADGRIRHQEGLPVRLEWAITARGLLLTDASRANLRRLGLPAPTPPMVRVRVVEPEPIAEPVQLTLLPEEADLINELYNLHLIRSDDGEPATPPTAYFRAYRDYLRLPRLTGQ